LSSALDQPIILDDVVFGVLDSDYILAY